MSAAASSDVRRRIRLVCVEIAVMWCSSMGERADMIVAAVMAGRLPISFGRVAVRRVADDRCGAAQRRWPSQHPTGLWSRRACCTRRPTRWLPSRFARTRGSLSASTRCRSSTRCCARMCSTGRRRVPRRARALTRGRRCNWWRRRSSGLGWSGCWTSGPDGVARCGSRPRCWGCLESRRREMPDASGAQLAREAEGWRWG